MLDNALQLATLVPIAIGVWGVFHGVRVYRRQMNAQLFLAFTARYEEIMSAFPDTASDSRLDVLGEPPPSNPKLTRVALRYLNLCSEEYYLWRSKYLDDDIWNIWEDELIRTLRSPLFVREWEVLRPHFESYREFVALVEEAQGDLAPT